MLHLWQVYTASVKHSPKILWVSHAATLHCHSDNISAIFASAAAPSLRVCTLFSVVFSVVSQMLLGTYTMCL